MLKDLFDRLSTTYDQDVIDCDNRGLFPFAGYQKVIDLIADIINSRRDTSTISLLDLGIGTGYLSSKLFPERLSIDGIDQSEKMLEIASLKVPNANLYLFDFRLGLPEEIRHHQYDFIVSTYAMHHLDEEEFLNYLSFLVDRLNPFGKIIIGDIMFQNAPEKEACRQANKKVWDDSENYHVFHRVKEKFKKNLSINYMKMSFCSGIIIIENYHEHTLQNCDVLVKY